MQLLKIVLRGFKSFAEKTTIELNEGITAIVGPNGSGKSNISDAIKWVLGEQNVRNLRGQKAEDIIFSGTEKRKPLGMAEVSLYFDNTDKSLDIEYSEVVITRRLFRSGDSEFYINKKSCRLKDIHALFADTGIGRDSMAVIGQNRIDQILNSRPEERRLIFEEVSGISRFKGRKLEALKKISETDRNLERISDMLHVLEEQLEPMAKRAEKTRRFQELDRERKNIEASLVLQKLRTAERILTKVENDRIRLAEEEAAGAAESGAVEARLLEFRQERDQLDEEVRSMEQQYSQARASHERILAQVQLRAEKVRETGERLERVKILAASAQQQQEERLQYMESIQEEMRQLRQQWETEKQRQEVFLKQLQDLRTAVHGRRNVYEERKTSVDRLEHQVLGLIQRIKVLDMMEKEGEGLSRATKEVLKSSQPWRKEICGAVAHLCQVPERYSVAIDAALGGTAQFIVTETEQAAKQAIRYLKERKGGRTTFLPIETIQARQLTKEETSALQEPGILGSALSLVSYDEKYEKIFSSLLAKILIAENLDAAAKAAKKYNYRLRLVALDGSQVNPGGSLSGGSMRQGEASLIGRHTMLAGLRREEEEQKQALEELRGSLVAAETALIGERNELERAEAQRQSQMVEAARLEIAVQAAEKEWQQEIKRNEEMISRQKREREEQKQIEKQIELETGQLAQDTEEEKRLQERMLELEKERQVRYDRQKEKRRLIQEMEEESQLLRSRLERLRQRVNEQDARIQRARFDIENEERQLADNGLTRQEAMEVRLPGTAEELQTALGRVHAAIAMLGPINPGAQAEYEEAKEHCAFMTAQHDDLVGARERLMIVLKEIDEAMGRQFTEAFKDISRYFQQTFSQLFEGGTGSLTLTDSGNILESGIEIFACPPGKKKQAMSLLSGGERSLTVIALLFSFLAYKPAPFCLVDEIDAALDEANVARFSNYLKNYTDDTQFIVVTHRRRTMEAATMLQGVTMEEKGVSKLITVKFGDELEVEG